MDVFGLGGNCRRSGTLPRVTVSRLVCSSSIRSAGMDASAARSHEQRTRSKRSIPLRRPRSPSLRGERARRREGGVLRARGAVHPRAPAGAGDHLAKPSSARRVRDPRRAFRRGTFPGAADRLPRPRLPARARSRASSVLHQRIHRLHAARAPGARTVPALHHLRHRGGTQRHRHRARHRTLRGGRRLHLAGAHRRDRRALPPLSRQPIDAVLAGSPRQGAFPALGGSAAV